MQRATRLRRHRLGRRTGRAERGRPRTRRRPFGRGGRTGTGRRRMLLLGLRSQQGVVAPGARRGRCTPRRRRPRSGHRLDRHRDGFSAAATATSPTGTTAARPTWVKSIGAELFRGHARLDGPRRVVSRDTRRRCRRAHRPPCGGHLHRQHRGGARHPRHRRGEAVDEPQGRPTAAPSQRRLAVVGGGGSRRRNGHRLARSRLAGHAVGTRLRRCCPGWSRSSASRSPRASPKPGSTFAPVCPSPNCAGPAAADPVGVTLDDGERIGGRRDPLRHRPDAEHRRHRPGDGRPRRRDRGSTSTTPAWSAVSQGDWLYALGDVNHRALLTHQGKYQARIAGAAIGARAAGRSAGHHTVGRARRHRRSHRGTAGVLHRPRGGARSDSPPRRPSSAVTASRSSTSTSVTAVPGANLYADGYAGRARMVVDLDHGHLLGAYLRRAGRGRTAALGHRRRRGTGADRPALACGAVLPDHQRGVAAPARSTP